MQVDCATLIPPSWTTAPALAEGKQSKGCRWGAGGEGSHLLSYLKLKDRSQAADALAPLSSGPGSTAPRLSRSGEPSGFLPRNFVHWGIR